MEVMIDIEALGPSPDGVILSIGAFGFSNYKDEWESQCHSWFSCTINQNQNKRIIGDKQKDFWESQPIEIKNKVFKGTYELSFALKKLHEYIKQYLKNGSIWANSISFDLAMLRHAFNQYEIECPWKHLQECEMRTLRHLEHAINLPDNLRWSNIKQKLINDGKGHVAIEDAEAQARYVYDWIQWRNK